VGVAVLPIKRFALMKSYVIIDAIKAMYIKIKAGANKYRGKG
jgi:hypothetical protein